VIITVITSINLSVKPQHDISTRSVMAFHFGFTARPQFCTFCHGLRNSRYAANFCKLRAKCIIPLLDTTFNSFNYATFQSASISAMEYRPGAFLEAHNGRPDAYLIILNAPIQNVAVLQRVWANSAFRLCADGGANRLHDLFGGRKGSSAAPRHRDAFVSIVLKLTAD